MKLFKSKAGFTLIELLVVIGILAVLAAIAIPSVAGLIDRANVSADKTNSNEMTNAIERFASEYELFCQDIASGTFDKGNMDSAQGRVYNVLGIEDRTGIELVEIDADEVVDDDAIAIYRDTKYPANAYTAQLIVQNYTKTSSSTFEPKQSDMHYWYSPDCGVVVFAEPNANIETSLNSQIISGTNAKGNKLNSNTKWIDLTDSITNQFDWTDIDKTTLSNNSWEKIYRVISSGKINKTEWKVGDTKTVAIDGQNKTVTMIGINHDGYNTATFMFTESIGQHQMNPRQINTGGWEVSEMRSWLNNDILNKMTDIKNYIKPVSKTTNNAGDNEILMTNTQDSLFLLSVKETNVDISFFDNREGYEFLSAADLEGNTYEWFFNNQIANIQFWLRSTYRAKHFFIYSNGLWAANFAYAVRSGQDTAGYEVCPAFVIG